MSVRNNAGNHPFITSFPLRLQEVFPGYPNPVFSDSHESSPIRGFAPLLPALLGLAWFFLLRTRELLAVGAVVDEKHRCADLRISPDFVAKDSPPAFFRCSDGVEDRDGP